MKNSFEKKKIVMFLVIVLVAFNLRAPITAVGPISQLIKEEYNLSSSLVGLITTLPLLAFAVASPIISKIVVKLQNDKVVLLGGLGLIVLGVLVRSYTNVVGIYLGTVILGVGIAVGNVLIPSLIKRNFATKVGLMSGIYTASMCAFAAVGAGSTMPLAKMFGFKVGLSVWIILAIMAIVACLYIKVEKVENNQPKVKYVKPTSVIWKSKLAWAVTLFMGIQSAVFYSLVAWIATIVAFSGKSAEFAGTVALVFQLVAIPVTMLIPSLCDKFKNQRPIILGVGSIYLCGIVLLGVAKSNALFILAGVLLSIGQGGFISLAIAFISLRSANGIITTQLSGMSQSVGYLLASGGPLLLGKIFDVFNNWNVALLVLGGLVLSLFVIGYFAGDSKVIGEK